MPGIRQAAHVQDLLLQAQRGTQNMMAESALSGHLGSAEWIRAGSAIADSAFPNAVASGEPVALYTVAGKTQWRGIGPMRQETISRPIVAGDRVSSSGGFASIDTMNFDLEAEAAMAHAVESFQGTVQTPQAYGVFLSRNPAQPDKAISEIRALNIVTSRGSLPLRVDGPTQVLEGARQLVLKPGEPIPTFYIEGSNQALIGIIDRNGATRGFHQNRILSIQR